MERSYHHPPPAEAPPPGTPAWITPDLIAHTRDVWESYMQRALTISEAVEILTNTGELFDALEEPPHAQQQTT